MAKEKKGVRLEHISKIYQDPKTGKQMERFTSSVMKSDVTEYHTFLAKLKDFIGTIKFQGSSVDTPNHGDSDWFDIDVKEYKLKDDDMDSESYCDDEDNKCKCKCQCCKDDDIIIVDKPFNGNITETYNLNCLWVRVQYIREYEKPATIEEIYYRN